MRSIFIVLLLGICAVAISGCYTLNAIGTPGDATLSMSNVPTGTVLNHFTVTMKVHHFIYGLVTAADPDVAKALSNEVKSAGGVSAINVKVHYQETFVDGLVNIITFGVYNPFTLTVEGDVIK
jgi:hypothetical protein